MSKIKYFCQKRISRWLKNSSGFTLIEMLIVIFVVGIGLVGALSFFSINVSNQNEAKKELIAAGLAQEGADLVRNIRDYNLLAGNNWYENLCSNGSGAGECDKCEVIDHNSVDGSSGLLHVCVQPDTQKCVCIEKSRYEQCACGDTNPKTDFKRTIEISRSSDLDESGSYLTITCTVSWDGRETEAKDVLYKNIF